MRKIIAFVIAMCVACGSSVEIPGGTSGVGGAGVGGAGGSGGSDPCAPDVVPVDVCACPPRNTWTNGAWLCQLCDCEGQTCEHVASSGEVVSGVCDADLNCSAPCPIVGFTPPYCENGVKDHGESDVDCGGPAGCQPCKDGSACQANSDCASGQCADSQICLP